MLLVIRTENAAVILAVKSWGEQRGFEFEFIETEIPPQNVVTGASTGSFWRLLGRSYLTRILARSFGIRNRDSELPKEPDHLGEEMRMMMEVWRNHLESYGMVPYRI